LIETIIIYKLPQLSREEVQAMLKVHDIREARVIKEAHEEGMKAGIQKGVEQGIEQERQRQFQEKLQSIARWAALNVSAEDIARILEIDVALVREHLTKPSA
jgi:predicted transposase/invertase (TIGR01784 family)